MTTYVVEITHDDSGDLSVNVREAGSSETDRAAIAWALREAAALVERGLPIERASFN